MTNKLFIKNMVCDRCKAAIKTELDNNKIHYTQIELGEITLQQTPSDNQLQNFKASIEPLGFELIEDRSARIVNQIKNTVLRWVREEENKNRKVKFSAYL